MPKISADHTNLAKKGEKAPSYERNESFKTQRLAKFREMKAEFCLEKTSHWIQKSITVSNARFFPKDFTFISLNFAKFLVLKKPVGSRAGAIVLFLSKNLKSAEIVYMIDTETVMNHLKL